MNLNRSLSLLVFLFFFTTTYSWGQAATFFIQDHWGGIIGISLAPDFTPSEPNVVRPMISSSALPFILDLEIEPSGGFQLTYRGTLIPLGDKKPPSTSFLQSPFPTGFSMAAGGQGGWIAAGTYVKSVGLPPRMVLPPLDSQTQITDIEYSNVQNELGILMEDGTCYICDKTKYRQYSVGLPNNRSIDLELYPGGLFVLSNQSRVSHFSFKTQTRIDKETPDLGSNIARDLELSPYGEGFYLLDVFGVIHACEGAPPIPTEPLTVNAAVDLEILVDSAMPQWYPPGWNTVARIEPNPIQVDPQGSARTVSIQVDGAENFTDFVTELRFDPTLINIIPNTVKPGRWWGDAMQGAHVGASMDAENGIFYLKGGGSFTPFEGASGNGKLVHFSLAAADPNLAPVSTELKLAMFTFQDASPWSVFRSAKRLHSSRIEIAPIQPEITLGWRKGLSQSAETQTVKPGDILRADLYLSNGSRIRDMEFSYSFPTDLVDLLGVTTGELKQAQIVVLSDLTTPNKANTTGHGNAQRLRFLESQAWANQPLSLVTFFFTATAKGNGALKIHSVACRDEKGNKIPLQTHVNELKFRVN